MQPLTTKKTLIGLAVAALIFTGGAALAADNCKEPETGTDTVPMLSPPLSEAVIGAGRLQFYSAPDENCAMSGVFVIP